MASKRKDSKGRVLKDGESQRKDGSYQYRYTEPGGYRRCVYAKTLETLRSKEQSIAADIRDGIGGEMSQMTVVELLDSHIRRRSRKIRASTKRNYTAHRNTIAKYPLGALTVRSVKQRDFVDMFIQMDDNGVAYSSISRMKTLLVSAFKDAVDNDAIRRNPVVFRLSDYIDDTTPKVMALTQAEIDDIVQYLKCSRHYSGFLDLFTVMLGTGVRAGELCGITLSDVDFKEGCIRISKQLRIVEGKMTVCPPKTDTGYRVIPMSHNVRTALEQIVWRRTHSVGIAEHIVDGHKGFMLTTSTGKPMSPIDLAESFRRVSKSYTKATGKQIKLTPHVLRHTFCTILSNDRISVKTIQYLMGHSTLSMLKVYDDPQYDVVRDEFQSKYA